MSSSSNQIKHTSDLAHHLLSVQCGCSICPHYRRYENIRCSTKSKQDKLCFIASQQTVMCSELQVNVYISYMYRSIIPWHQHTFLLWHNRNISTSVTCLQCWAIGLRSEITPLWWLITYKSNIAFIESPRRWDAYTIPIFTQMIFFILKSIILYLSIFFKTKCGLVNKGLKNNTFHI